MTPLIVTVTPNPSLDRTMEVEVLRHGAVIRATATRTDAGGKGVNVARALVGNGHKARCLLPAGGWEGRHLMGLLGELGIDATPIPIEEPIRANVTVVEPDGTVTKLNAPGPRLSPTEAEALEAAVVDAASEASWVALCGSLPPGLASDVLPRTIRAARQAGARLAIDTSGEALAAAVDAGPDLIKPNQHELAEIAGREIATLGDVVQAAEALRARGVGAVAVSLGADGAVLVDDSGAVHAETPPQLVRSAVGAGDALLAGVLAAGAHGPEALLEGVAWGAAAAGLPGTAMPEPDDLERDRVDLHAVEPVRPIRSTA